MKNLRWLITAVLACSLVPVDLAAQDKGLQPGLMRASQVHGMDVKNPEGKNLGDIQDVVVDQQTGTIAYAVLSFGGFLGIGDKLFAVPWAALKPTANQKAFTLNLAKDRLEKAPGFDKDKWPELTNRQWGADIHTYYGVTPYWEVRGGTLVSDGGGTPAGMLMRTKKLIGMDVRNAENKNLGDIQDVVLDQQAGAVAYAVLSFGGFLGIGDKLFAVPWTALKPSTDRKTLALDLPKERLEKAPGFDKKNWPDLDNRQWATEIHTYYGATPYWEVRGGGMVAAKDAPTVQEVKLFTGKVTKFTKEEPALVMIKTDSGEIQAELAPMSFLYENRLVFADDDLVTVRAYETMREGRKVYVVTEVKTKEDRTIRLRRDDLTPVWLPVEKPAK